MPVVDVLAQFVAFAWSAPGRGCTITVSNVPTISGLIVMHYCWAAMLRITWAFLVSGPGTFLALAIAFSPGSAQAQDARRPGEVTVKDNGLLRDGLPWIPHGFVQIAFVAPPGVENMNPVFGVARRNYSPQEYLQMRTLGADSVRIQVSQPGLDPANILFSQSFLEHVVGAIQAARTAGLTVILSSQDESQSGETDPADLPNDATRRVWKELAPMFGHDRGVLFELFNEPRLQVSPQNWQAWADAMNRTIDTVRATGATNVVVADGLEVAEQLGGAPHLTDTLGQVAYASHPYAHDQSDQERAAWKGKFGNFAKDAPVIITEWTAGAYKCNDRTAESTVSFLHYIQDHKIGLEAVTWDWSTAHFGSVIYDFPASKLSAFTGPAGALSCGDPGYGPGLMIEFWYATGAPPDWIL